MNLGDLTAAQLFTPWAWFVAALVLAGLEIVAPGVFMIWLAAAAAVTGVIALTGIGWELQLVVFAVLAVASVIAGRNWLRRHPSASSDPSLNRRDRRLVGQVVTVVEAIRDGEGRVRVGDSPWLASGPDTDAGARVRIVAVEGATVLVEPA